MSVDETNVINNQWVSLRESIVTMIDELISDEGDNRSDSISIGNSIVLSDVSGSMEGPPLEISIALGILVSELNHPAFRDLVLTFSSIPEWHRLPSNGSLSEKVRSLQSATWGMSTDILKAMEQIALVAIKGKLSSRDIPTLIIVTDMEFDQGAGHGWDTTHEQIVTLFHDTGMKICGIPYDPPLIVYYNVRESTTTFPCKADEKGVVLIGGRSAALLKYILSGMFSVADEPITPRMALQLILSEKRLDLIRDTLHDPIVQSTLHTLCESYNIDD